MRVFLGLGFLVVIGACSSTIKSTANPDGGASDTSGTNDTNDKGDDDACSCNVSYNGVSKSLSCGEKTCVNGATYSCSASGASRGIACAEIPDGGETTEGGATSGCGLFTCTDTDGCGNIAPCMSTDTSTSYCYEQEANAASCSNGTTPTTAIVDGSPRTLCVPAGCPQPRMWLR